MEFFDRQIQIIEIANAILDLQLVDLKYYSQLDESTDNFLLDIVKEVIAASSTLRNLNLNLYEKEFEDLAEHITMSNLNLEICLKIYSFKSNLSVEKLSIGTEDNARSFVPLRQQMVNFIKANPLKQISLVNEVSNGTDISMHSDWL